jgi:hypothetical protein
MSASNAPSREGELPAPPSLARAQALLEEALRIIDTHADASDIGARLQEVIDAVNSRTG